MANGVWCGWLEPLYLLARRYPHVCFLQHLRCAFDIIDRRISIARSAFAVTKADAQSVVALFLMYPNLFQ
jgi:hypothetical protein